MGEERELGKAGRVESLGPGHHWGKGWLVRTGSDKPVPQLAPEEAERVRQMIADRQRERAATDEGSQEE